MRFVTTGIWEDLAQAARRSKKPAHVAVAYFGKGAAELLRLPAGSRLVVDASPAAVKSGQTHPADLKKLLRRKVAIYSAQNLHAKVFVFDEAVYVGSANASQHSATVLLEAMLRVTDRAATRATRAFVNELCLERLGPEELDRLQKLYRPPIFVPGRGDKGPRIQTPRLRAAHLMEEDISDDLDKAMAAGKRDARAKRQHGPTFQIDDFHWPSSSGWSEGQLVTQVWKRGGNGRSVSPPGHVIHIRHYQKGKEHKTLVYVESRKEGWKALSRCSKEVQRILKGDGFKSASHTKALMGEWARADLMGWTASAPGIEVP